MEHGVERPVEPGEVVLWQYRCNATPVSMYSCRVKELKIDKLSDDFGQYTILLNSATWTQKSLKGGTVLSLLDIAEALRISFRDPLDPL